MLWLRRPIIQVCFAAGIGLWKCAAAHRRRESFRFLRTGYRHPGQQEGIPARRGGRQALFFFGKITEHGDIIQDGAVKEKYVLLYDGNKVIQGIRPEGAQFPAVIPDLP